MEIEAKAGVTFPN